MMNIEASSAAVLDSRKDEHHDDDDDKCSSSTTSSIGKNSDVSSENERIAENENEVQSAYNGPFDMMDSLEEVLPIRRGISKFYNGKSKSFASLADAASSASVKDIAKAENAYSRRRRNLMAFNHVWDKLRSNGGGISKRTMSMNSSRSALALAFAVSSYDSTSSFTSEDSSSNSRSPTPPRSLPPLHRRNRLSGASTGPSSPLQRSLPAWRSFSVADLHYCGTAATVNMPDSTALRNDAAHPS
ncbi:protein OXIDATIVE STRESS 3 LIKE 1 [Arachis stenosperma]|uniref:protein OXIDATIVE STRESS 3 LIKE 1 n=1 Tax=Arachis stenosperma TaxID=217475 RepID=UPI0025ACAD32|nr:protein OXIDATIVE STRESS 3 LIKE 1 [Arachis stenosperma]